MDEQQITDIATRVYKNLGTQYGVAEVPAHTHNNIDTPSFPVNNLQGYYQPIVTYSPPAAGTATLDISKSNICHVTMPAGNVTLAVSGARVGQCFIVRILQDSVGSRTVTWFSTIKWPGAIAPTLTTTANKADSFGFEITGAGTYDGFVIGQNL